MPAVVSTQYSWWSGPLLLLCGLAAGWALYSDLRSGTISGSGSWFEDPVTVDEQPLRYWSMIFGEAAGALACVVLGCIAALRL